MTFWRVFYLTLKIKCEVSFSYSELQGKAFVEKCFKKIDNQASTLVLKFNFDVLCC